MVKPQSCGIGGYGGFLTYTPPGEPVVQLDFNTWVPRRLEDPTLREPGIRDPPSMGGAAVAPMAVVPGLLAAHKRFGRRPLAELLEPAIRLAGDGFTIGAARVLSGRAPGGAKGANPGSRRSTSRAAGCPAPASCSCRLSSQ